MDTSSALPPSPLVDELVQEGPHPRTSSRLRLVLGDGIDTIRLTIPGMDVLVERLEHFGDARVVTIESVSASFCEGLDIPWLRQHERQHVGRSISEAALERYAAVLRKIEMTPVPVVALVNGPARGGGVGLVAAADLVIASPAASFALPEALMGLIPAMVFPVIARRIGVPRARLLALGGKPLSAAAAHGLGLVDEVAEAPEAALRPYLQRFLRMDRRALAAIKRLVAAHFTAEGDYHADAASQFADLWHSRETRSRVARFAIGRAPWPVEDQP